MLERGDVAAAAGAAAAQRHDLPLEPARSTTSCAAARTCAWRTACCPPARRSSTSLANAAFYYGLVRVLAEDDRPIWSQMSFSAAEENFHAGARDGIDARVYWPGRRRGAGGRAGAAPAAADGPRGPRPLGRRRRRPRPPARHHRAPLRRRSATARPGRPPTFHRLYDDAARPRRRAARDDRALPRAHALQRAGPHLARRLTVDDAPALMLTRPRVERARRSASGCVAESSGCHAPVLSGDLPVMQFKDRRRPTRLRVCVRPVTRCANRTTGKPRPGTGARGTSADGKHVVRWYVDGKQVARWNFDVRLERDESYRSPCWPAAAAVTPSGGDLRVETVADGARDPVGDRVPARRPRAGHRAAGPGPPARRRRPAARDPVAEVDVSDAGRGRPARARARPGLRRQPPRLPVLHDAHRDAARALALRRRRGCAARPIADRRTIQAGTIHDCGRIALRARRRALRRDRRGRAARAGPGPATR